MPKCLLCLVLLIYSMVVKWCNVSPKSISFTPGSNMLISAINGRPRNVRFYMDLSAGSESEFHSKVSPILDGAGLEHFLMSKYIDHNCVTV